MWVSYWMLEGPCTAASTLPCCLGALNNIMFIHSGRHHTLEGDYNGMRLNDNYTRFWGIMWWVVAVRFKNWNRHSEFSASRASITLTGYLFLCSCASKFVGSYTSLPLHTVFRWCEPRPFSSRYRHDLTVSLRKQRGKAQTSNRTRDSPVFV
jgi:hypothetical protein